jgi:hypothetical protein
MEGGKKRSFGPCVVASYSGALSLLANLFRTPIESRPASTDERGLAKTRLRKR